MILVEQIIAEYLRSKDIGTDPSRNGDWPVYWGRLPDRPETCISIHRDSIQTQGREHRPGWTVHHEGFQVRIRDKKYELAQKKILEVSILFDATRQFVLSVGTQRYRIQSINQPMTPTFIGPDTNNLCNFTLNCNTSIREL